MRRGGLENLLGQLLPVAAVVLGLYWIYKRLPSVADIGRAGSEAWNLFTQPPVTSEMLSVVVLPDGTNVNAGDIVNAGSMIDGKGFFTWRGVQYQITGRDPDLGYYLTKRIVT
jgi:hypothetical protein